MKSQFLFVALPLSTALVSTGFAVTYLTAEQAQQVIYPGKSLATYPLTLTSGQRKAIEEQSHVRFTDKPPQVWKVSGGGWFIVDEVVGKHEFITYGIGLTSEGAVKGIEIMEYRESYGGQVRDPKWRAQFIGKTNAAPLKLDEDIKNISGATLSSRHLTEGVRRVLALHHVALR